MQDEIAVEDSAKTLVDYLLENDLMDQVTFSERAEGFRLKLEFADLPEDIVAAGKRCCREMSTTVNTVKTRVKFLSVKLIEDGLVLEMKRAMETLDSWIEQYVMDSTENQQEYGDQFFVYVNESSGAPTTVTSAQPKAKQQSSAQAGADQTSAQAGADKPKGALKFRDSGRGKKGSKKPQLELNSGKGDPKSTVGERLELNLLQLKL